MSNNELNPCRCGCKAELVDSQTFAWCNVYYYVRCTNPDCDEQTTLKYEHKVDAINAWNVSHEYNSSPNPWWCEDCKHFGHTDMGGEGYCDKIKERTWYGCPICHSFTPKGADNEQREAD